MCIVFCSGLFMLCCDVRCCCFGFIERFCWGVAVISCFSLWVCLSILKFSFKVIFNILSVQIFFEAFQLFIEIIYLFTFKLVF